MDIKFETLDRWPYGGNGTGDRRAPFKASYPKTVALLKDELDRANARNAGLQTGHIPEDIRFDGLPKVNARKPRFAGVCLSFEMFLANCQVNERGQRLGSYEMIELPCATFNHWEDNVRAIALTLKALRDAKKYGIGKIERDEHYDGLRRRRLDARTGADNTGAMTPEAAASVLAACAEAGYSADVLLRSGADMEAAYKLAARKTHPDIGGSAASMAKVNEAARVLREHIGGQQG